MTSKKPFVQAVKWAYLGNWGERACSALFIFILASVLEPQDFGVVAIAMVYVNFLQLFLDQGFLAALIQRKDIEPEHLDAVFWMDVALSLLLVGMSILVSGWWATRNHAPEAAKLIVVLSLCIPIEGLAAVQSAILSRNMDFKALSIRSNIAIAVSGVIGISMAFDGFRVWALVGQQISRDLTALFLLWRLSPWRPRISFSWRHLKDLTSFSFSSFAAQLAGFVDAQSSSILLGLFFGPVAVGLYRLADRLVGTVVAVATTSIQAVSLPEFARVQDQIDELRKSALACIRLSSTVTLPALSGVVAVSGAMMATLGPRWIPASDALRVLCLAGMCAVFASFTGPMLQAVSKPHYTALLAWARVVATTVLLVAAGVFVRDRSVAWQLMGIAAARCIAIALLVMPVFLGILVRVAGIPLRDLASAVAPSVFASVCTFATVFLLQLSSRLADARPLVLMVAEIAVGGAAGLTVLLALDAQLCRFAVSLPQRMLRSFTEGRA